MTKRIVLCADDYGQAPAISQGIIALIEKQRLCATSCMVNTPFWQEHAKWLSSFQDKIDIGLHFNLTEGNALSSEWMSRHSEILLPLATLMRKAFLRRLDTSAIEAECHAQIDAFVEALGFLPMFVDGHQHIHQFPVIRHVFLRVYEDRLRAANTYVRLVNEPIKPREIMSDLKGNLKKMIIYGSGTNALRQLLLQHKIPHNQSFAGIYSFERAYEYQTLFPRFLKAISHNGLIMCHPGLASPLATDVIANARYEEYQYLSSLQFESDCRQENVVLARFQQRHE